MKGWRCYLAYVIDTQKVSTTLEEIPIIRYFPKVFPKELTELPPQCEVEFVIELEANMAPILKSP